MIELQGITPAENTKTIDSDKKIICPTTKFPSYTSELTNSKPTVDRSILGKNIFFFCENCSGPLVPISKCEVCNKTSIRKCTKCDLEIIYENHTSCNYLILLKNMRLKRCMKGGLRK